MWPLGGVSDDNMKSTTTNNNSNRGGLNGVSSSTSSKSSASPSSTSSSSPSPFSPSSTLHSHPNPQAKTMEEVWKDINLGSLYDHNSRETPHANNFRGMNLQDFLSRPFSRDPAQANIPAGYCSPSPPPATMLTLHSGRDFHFLGDSEPLSHASLLQPHHTSNANYNSFSTSLDVLASSSGLSSNGKKRSPESDNSAGDRLHKRMIKNRESAARSRARKQAYTYELEMSVRHLEEENARLRQQQQELRLGTAAQLPNKSSLSRTSTAPF